MDVSLTSAFGNSKNLSENSCASSCSLLQLLENFQDWLARLSHGVKDLTPEDNSWEELISNLSLLIGYELDFRALVNDTLGALDHRLHLDLAPLIADQINQISEMLVELDKDVFSTDGSNDDLMNALRNKLDEGLEGIPYRRAFQNNLKVWKDTILDLPCISNEHHELSPSMSKEPDVELLSDFTYEKLPTSTSIRLVEMQTTDEPDDIVSVTLKVFDLNDRPTYSALSYTWGKPTLVFMSRDERAAPYNSRAPILCNRKLHYIRQNLYKYMLH